MQRSLPIATPLSRRWRLLLALPKFALILLVIAIVALLWLLHRNEVEQERATLIKDVLWLEQNLRFHLTSHEDQLMQLAVDMAGTRENARRLFGIRAPHLVKNNPEITRIIWLDNEHHLIEAVPASGRSAESGEVLSEHYNQRAYENARLLGKLVYSDPYFAEDQNAYIEQFVPLFRHNVPSGMLVVLLPLNALLNNQVPWWFTQKYKVSIVDNSEVQYASKTSIEGNAGQSYEIPFDPPGKGLRLRVTSHRTADNTLPRLLTVAIVILASGILWSLWLVREQMKKRTEAESALRAEHAFRTSMEDSLTVGMRARDLDGRIIYVNPSFCQMTGFSSEELVDHRPPMPYWVPEHLDDTFALHQAVLDGRAPTDGFEITFQRKNGQRFNALVYEAKLIDGHGRHTGWMASVIDITERKRTEEKARQQEAQLQFTARLVTMGEMASTLAHELNQPLAAIASYNTGCLNLLDRDASDTKDLREAMEKIGVQAQRAGKIIRRVHDFVRKSEPKRAPCSLRDIIEDCLGFIEADARKRRVRVEANLPELPQVLADRVMLEQVLLNLLRNGMDAMVDTPDNEKLLRLTVDVHSNEVRISVADQGCGIPPEIEAKLFTAFFSTKPDGMGIGLSICRSIIEFHRGRLWADENPQSTTGQGTIFAFTLPLESV